LFSASSGAATLSCPNFDDSDVPAQPAGQTGFLFIGTQVSTGSSSITVTYHVDGGGDQQATFPGDQQGNGAFHYIVSLPQGAVVTAATVTGATDQTNITVSGCLNGPPATTTTTTTTTGGTTVSGNEVTTAGPSVEAATAVQSPAKFTG
jgi:hypothetical protein